MNYTLLSDFCTIYRIPKIQEKLNTLYPNFDQKIPYTWIKMARDTVYPKPLAGPEEPTTRISNFRGKQNSFLFSDKFVLQSILV